MQEVKQLFPGNRINGFLMELSKWLLGAIVLVSVLEWETPPNTSFAVHFGIDGTYVPFFCALDDRDVVIPAQGRIHEESR